jgi:hypothetical protein
VIVAKKAIGASRETTEIKEIISGEDFREPRAIGGTRGTRAIAGKREPRVHQAGNKITVTCPKCGLTFDTFGWGVCCLCQNCNHWWALNENILNERKLKRQQKQIVDGF